MEEMTEEQILADLEAFDKEAVPDVRDRAARLEFVPPASQGPRATTTQQGAQEGEAPVETSEESEKAHEEEDAGKDTTGAEPTQELEGPTDDERPRDPVTGRFVKGTEDAHGKETAPEPESQPASKYEKAKKEVERQKSLLAGFDEEKAKTRAQFAAERAEIEREKQRIQEEKLKVRQQFNGRRPVDENGEPIYSSYELRQTARDFRRRAFKGEQGPNGEDYGDLSERAEARAEIEAKREAREQQELFQRRQTQLSMETMQAHPELVDPKSELVRELNAVFEQEKAMAAKNERPSVFELIPDGFAVAVEIAKLRQKAFASDAKDKKIADLQAEVNRLNKLTTLGSSSPRQTRQPKAAEDMTADEALAELDALAKAEGAQIWNR